MRQKGGSRTCQLPTTGYFDTILQLGYVGLAFLIVFTIATLHAVKYVADRDPIRAQLLLSLVLFFILYNFFESLWMQNFEVLWLVLLVAAAEIGRYWRPASLRTAAYGLRSQRRDSASPSPGAQMSRLRGAL